MESDSYERDTIVKPLRPHMMEGNVKVEVMIMMRLPRHSIDRQLEIRLGVLANPSETSVT